MKTSLRNFGAFKQPTRLRRVLRNKDLKQSVLLQTKKTQKRPYAKFMKHLSVVFNLFKKKKHKKFYIFQRVDTLKNNKDYAKKIKFVKFTLTKSEKIHFSTEK